MSQRITITLPDDVYHRIKEQASRDMRTIGAEITYLLKLYVPQYATVATAGLSYPPGVRSVVADAETSTAHKKSVIG